jgi:hypothetical protein
LGETRSRLEGRKKRGAGDGKGRLYLKDAAIYDTELNILDGVLIASRRIIYPFPAPSTDYLAI